MSAIRQLTNWEELQSLIDTQMGDSEEMKVDFESLKNHLLSRVRGQDATAHDLAKLVCLQYARKNRDKPVCNLMLMGPTGTGKTELAKALAEYLFEDEKNMIRFDCSELSGEHSKDRLIGMPTGYVGSESGGQLTRPVMSSPKRVILFDEIEKAHPSVFDLFLQLMGEGRLTEQGSGKTVDFTQCVMVLTSNSQFEKLAAIKKETKNYHDMINAMKSHLADNQIFRPELLGRIDRLYVFDALKREVIAEISLMKIQKLAKSFSVELDFVSPALILQALEANHKISRFGVRELERIIFDLFAPGFASAKQQKLKRLALDLKPDGSMMFRRIEEPVK